MRENKYLTRLRNDIHLRISISLYGSLAFNTAYSLLQLGLGILHGSVWYYSMAVYQILLALMRFFLLRHTRAYHQTENMKAELIKYGLCGLILLFVSSVLTAVVFYMIFHDSIFNHHEITVIAMAAYTFTAFTLSAVNAIRYKKYSSPVFSAAKTVNMSAACVSMLTLEASMLSTFGMAEDPHFRRLMLGLSGAAIFIYIAATAVCMMIRARKGLKIYGRKNKIQET